MKKTRRDVLARGGLALAAAVGLAGCGSGGSDGTATDASGPGTDTSGPATDTAAETPIDATTPTATPTDVGTRTDTSTDTATATAGPDGPREPTPANGVVEWLPAPADVEQTPDTGYAFRGLAPRAVMELEGSLPGQATDPLAESGQIPGVETLGDLRGWYNFARSVTVFVTDIERAATEQFLRDNGFSAAGTHRGYSVFATDPAGAAAVGDGALVSVGPVSSEDDTDKLPVVETVLDAKTGNGTRYVDTVPECGALVDSLGAAHALQGRTHDPGATFDGAEGEGISIHIAPSRTRIRASVVFAEGRVDADAVADWAGDDSAFYGQAVTTETNGRTVASTALAPADTITRLFGPFPGPAIETDDPPGRSPVANFEFAYESTGDGVGLLEVTHVAGDNIDADRLFVEGSGFADVAGADQTSAGPWQGSTLEGNVAAGSSVAVGVRSDYDVQVVWRAESGSDAAVLASDTGPDA